MNTTKMTDAPMLTNHNNENVFTEALAVAVAYRKKYGTVDALERLRVRQLALAPSVKHSIGSRFAYVVVSDATKILLTEYAMFGK